MARPWQGNRPRGTPAAGRPPSRSWQSMKVSKKTWISSLPTRLSRNAPACPFDAEQQEAGHRQQKQESQKQQRQQSDETGSCSPRRTGTRHAGRSIRPARADESGSLAPVDDMQEITRPAYPQTLADIVRTKVLPERPAHHHLACGVQLYRVLDGIAYIDNVLDDAGSDILRGVSVQKPKVPPASTRPTSAPTGRSRAAGDQASGRWTARPLTLRPKRSSPSTIDVESPMKSATKRFDGRK